MIKLDINSLLSDISSNSKSGEDLENDVDFLKMERVAQEEPENSVGNPDQNFERKNSKPSQNWSEVGRLAAKLLERSHDIRITVMLARASAHKEGFEGINQSFKLINGLIEHYWESVHPRKDEEDPYPMLLINSLKTLTDYECFLKPIKSLSLIKSPSMGLFSWHDVELAKGVIQPNSDTPEIPKISEIEAAFIDCDFEVLILTIKNVEAIIEQTQILNELLIEKVNGVNAPEFSVLIDLLKDIESFLQKHLSKNKNYKNISTSSHQKDINTIKDQNVILQDEAQINTQIDGIGSRLEVVKSIEAIEQYFKQYEPSSPVPFLLQRAKKLLTMNFIEIMQDLAPDSVSEVENVCGRLDSFVVTNSQDDLPISHENNDEAN